MEYLNRVLGIRVTYQDKAIESVPKFILSKYRIQKVTLDETEAVFLYPRTELEAISAIKQHILHVQKAEGVPVVLVPDRLTYREKEYLLRDHIPFIVDGKQIYLPFMAVYLQERSDGEKQNVQHMLPSTQMLLIYYIYHGCGELLTSHAAKALDITPTSVSRASKQLESFGLIKTEHRGTQKVILSGHTPKGLFMQAMDYFNNPIKRTVFVPKAELKENLLTSGLSALSEYTMLNPPSVHCYASSSISKWKDQATTKLQNAEYQAAVELWRYDPKKLSRGNCVDLLSLALALRENKDERVEEAVEQMLELAWRQINCQQLKNSYTW